VGASMPPLRLPTCMQGAPPAGAGGTSSSPARRARARGGVVVAAAAAAAVKRGTPARAGRPHGRRPEGRERGRGNGMAWQGIIDTGAGPTGCWMAEMALAAMIG
jgi:hypothetical protein